MMLGTNPALSTIIHKFTVPIDQFACVFDLFNAVAKAW